MTPAVSAPLRARTSYEKVSERSADERLVKVVIVDDDAMLCDFMEAALTRDGLQLFQATSALAGWELIKRVHPRVVLLDVLLPELNGLDLLEKIIDWDPAIHVVIVSGDHSAGAVVEAMRRARRIT